jgi:histidinol phosphatase-like PHP family hydrolase
MNHLFDKLIDFHTHTQLSDGILLPAEHVRHAAVAGYGVIGIADHADAATLEHILATTLRLRDETQKYLEDTILIVAGIELTHIPPAQIGDLTRRSRELGAEIVIVHGETCIEPVYPGTNRAAIEARADILAHPGFITAEEAAMAKEFGVYLEITQKWGHNVTNGYVAKVAKRTGAKLVLSSDSHCGSRDMLAVKRLPHVLLGAGLSEDDMNMVLANNRELAEKVLAVRKSL